MNTPERFIPKDAIAMPYMTEALARYLDDGEIPNAFIVFHDMLARADARRQKWQIVENYAPCDFDEGSPGLVTRKCTIVWKNNGTWWLNTVQWNPRGYWVDADEGEVFPMHATTYGIVRSCQLKKS